MVILELILFIFDEIDLGLDIDVFCIVFEGVNFFKNFDNVILVIIYY